MGNCGQGSSGNRACGSGVVDDSTVSMEVQAAWDKYRAMHALDPITNDPDALNFLQHLWDQALALDKSGVSLLFWALGVGLSDTEVGGWVVVSGKAKVKAQADNSLLCLLCSFSGSKHT